MNDKKLKMENSIPFDLIAKCLSDQCSEDEKKHLDTWINKTPENKETFEQMRTSWDEIPSPDYEPNVENALEKISSKLPKQSRRNSLTNTVWMRIAAILIIGLGIFGVYKYFSGPVEIIEIATNAENIKKVILPDGSMVYLGKNSEIKYPEKFDQELREIEFSGEAYFDIEPNKEKPFVIASGIAVTKVLGTEFNLSAKKSDTLVKVTVTEGLVSLNLNIKDIKKEVLIQVGEVGKLNLVNKELSKNLNNDPNFLAWKNGKLSFENKMLKDALKELSDYYGKEFQAYGDLNNERFNGYFDSVHLEEAIDRLEMILDVTIVDEGEALVLQKK